MADSSWVRRVMWAADQMATAASAQAYWLSVDEPTCANAEGEKMAIARRRLHTLLNEKEADRG